jgi:hypothetical protein
MLIVRKLFKIQKMNLGFLKFFKYIMRWDACLSHMVKNCIEIGGWNLSSCMLGVCKIWNETTIRCSMEVFLWPFFYCWTFYLTPKGLWVPYMKFRDFGHTTMIPICNWIFWNFFGGWEIQSAFQISHSMQDLDLYCRSYGNEKDSFHLRTGRAVQKSSSNIFLENKRELCHVRKVHTYKGSFGSFHSN